MIRMAIKIFLLLLCVIFQGGCSATVYPPAALVEPVTIYIASYGKHSSLILPTRQGQYAEYATGDWPIYVENKDSYLSYVRAGLLSRKTALARRDIRTDDVNDASFLGVLKLIPIEVEYLRAAALSDELDTWFVSALRLSPDYPVYNPLTRLHAVPWPRQYRVWDNCNHQTSRWLRQIGCDVRGMSVLADYKIRHRNAGATRPSTEGASSEKTPENLNSSLHPHAARPH